MDRKGKQKLKRYFIVYVIFAVFFTVGMYLITKYEENAKATQIALLLAEHPELEGEIVAIWEKSGTVDFIRDRDDQKIERVVQMLEETYGYHSGSGSSDVVIRIIWGIGLLVGVIVCSLFLYLDRRKNWSRYGDEEQLQQLYECLQEFRKGKFQTYPEETSESEQWLKVWESVKELGQYFEDLKERLEQEENGTKSLITDISHQLKIGFIFQDFNLIPSLNVWENIVLPLGLDNRKVKPREVEDILKKIGLQDKKDAMPSALSGGQKQRTAIARALVTRPAIILADEPTGNLDSQTELEVMSLLKSCVSDFGQTLIMITHDETIAQMADEMIIIEDGKAVRR